MRQKQGIERPFRAWPTKVRAREPCMVVATSEDDMPSWANPLTETRHPTLPEQRPRAQILSAPCSSSQQPFFAFFIFFMFINLPCCVVHSGVSTKKTDCRTKPPVLQLLLEKNQLVPPPPHDRSKIAASIAETKQHSMVWLGAANREKTNGKGHGSRHRQQ